MICSVPSCTNRMKARGLCESHYGHAKRAGTIQQHPLKYDYSFRNPLVCVCEVPQADPAVNWGECAICRRCPLSLFRILRNSAVAA